MIIVVELCTEQQFKRESERKSERERDMQAGKVLHREASGREERETLKSPLRPHRPASGPSD